MTPHSGTISRRVMLKASGALVVSFALAPSDVFGQAVATLVGNPPKELDGWLSIGADNIVTAYTGKCEMGHLCERALRQLCEFLQPSDEHHDEFPLA